MLTGSFDYAMMAWSIARLEPVQLHRFDDNGGAVNAVAFTPRAAQAVSGGDDGAVALWDLETGKLVHRFLGHEGKVVGLAVSSDGRWAASAGWDRTARLWDLSSLKPGPVLRGHTGPVNAVAFSGDRARLYTASYDGTIGAFEVFDGTFRGPVFRHGWGINVLRRLPGSEQLVFGALNGSVGVVDAEKGEVVAEIEGNERPVLALDVIEKPGLIAVGGGDGVIRVIRAGDWAVIEDYQNPYGPVWALAFAPDGTALYYAGLDDFVTLWQISPREPFEPIESPFPRRFQRTRNADDPVAQGEIEFARKCSVCHTVELDGKNRAGPTLYHVFGRRIASLPDYPYSDALRQLDIVWTEETVAKLFELGPEIFTPGSKMPLQKMTNPKQREALIAYLKAATSGAFQSPPAGGGADGAPPPNLNGGNK